MALPVLAVGDTVQVPGSGQQGLVPRFCNICHLILVLLLVSFPDVDNSVWFQLHTHTHTVMASVIMHEICKENTIKSTNHKDLCGCFQL